MKSSYLIGKWEGVSVGAWGYVSLALELPLRLCPPKAPLLLLCVIDTQQLHTQLSRSDISQLVILHEYTLCNIVRMVIGTTIIRLCQAFTPLRWPSELP